jgi:hypothetical protein
MGSAIPVAGRVHACAVAVLVIVVVVGVGVVVIVVVVVIIIVVIVCVGAAVRYGTAVQTPGLEVAEHGAAPPGSVGGSTRR